MITIVRIYPFPINHNVCIRGHTNICTFTYENVCILFFSILVNQNHFLKPFFNFFKSCPSSHLHIPLFLRRDFLWLILSRGFSLKRIEFPAKRTKIMFFESSFNAGVTESVGAYCKHIYFFI